MIPFEINNIKNVAHCQYRTGEIEERLCATQTVPILIYSECFEGTVIIFGFEN
jgi:hypothetical protein